MRARYFATAPRGFEDLLALELETLGAAQIRQSPGGVHFSGMLETGYRVCLWSRLSEHVLLQIARFQASSPETLYEQIRGILWREHLDTSSTLAVDFTSRHPDFGHTHFAALRVKDAIVDQFREATGKRPSVALTDPDVRIHVHAAAEGLSVSIDLAGSGLHRRGYRVQNVAAPLKETLAAGVLLRAGWPQCYRAGGALVDPLCGSATFLIEAAWMALDVAPGSLRDRFGFLGWHQHDPGLWQKLRLEAEARARAARSVAAPVIEGYDADERGIAAAWANLARAGLSKTVRVTNRDLAALAPPESAPSAGLVVTNPPYGERIGTADTVKPLYRTLGTRLKSHFPGWMVAVLAGEDAPADAIGLQAARTHRVFNGPIRCRLIRYQIRDPKEGIAPVRADAKRRQAATDASAFANRLRKNLRTLGRWAARGGFDCYRVYDADVPEFALAVDLYQVDPPWAHVQEYAPPASVDSRRAAERLRVALEVLPGALGVPPSQVVFKRRKRQRGRDQYQRMAQSEEFLEVNEGGCRLLVNLKDRIDTGLYLDHRPTRFLIRELANGKRFLNLYAYTGAATVHAAAGGAASTLSIDLSSTYIEWARRNLELNGLSGPHHVYLRADCSEWIRDAPQAGFDLVFIDAPTFSNSKRMRDTFDVQRDHVELIRRTMRLLSPDGILLFSNHAKRFRIDRASLGELILEDITRQTIPKDFLRRPKIHNCWRISHRRDPTQ
jgi:23S rRNA (guanine2445-N2)-methyltransferase / 23S rRNA (guanine2069-N7)-methyltransferase